MNANLIAERLVPEQYSRAVEEEHIARYEFASRYVVGKQVLDIACGAGYGAEILAKAGARSVEGVDISVETIVEAKQNYGSETIQFTVGDMITYNSGRLYDVITSFETIEHVSDYQNALNNLRKLLKPEGLLIISTPNRPMSWRPVKTMYDKPFNPYHVREFNLEEFKHVLVEHGFSFEDKDVYGQRAHIYIQNRYLRKIYHELFKPYTHTSPAVLPVGKLPPLFTVVVAKKT